MTSVLNEHLGYLSLPHRLTFYQSAVEKCILPGDRVVDAGCGTGVLGLLCLRAGASKVYAIDSSAALDLARQSLTQAGWADKVTFVNGSTFQLKLPERADVVICDHIGYFGFDYGLIDMIADARRRFLKPGGKIIPNRLKLCIAAVESEKCRQLLDAWIEPKIPEEFHWIRQHAVNSKHAVHLQSDDLLTPPTTLCCIDLQTENPGFFSWSHSLTVSRDGVMHGLGGWFSCELAPDIWMTNSPLSDQSINRAQAFFPIENGLVVQVGDLLLITLQVRPAEHLIAWTVEHPASGKKYSHSTWKGDLLEPDRFRKTLPHHVPQPSQKTLARHTILTYCDGHHTVAQIQQAVLRDHPSLFPTPEEILRFTTAVLAQDTE